MNLQRLDNGSFVCPEDPGEPELRTPRVSISDKEIFFIQSWCLDQIVVEIGTGLGVSTRAIAQCAASLVTVDIDPWVKANVWPTLTKSVGRAEGTAHYPDHTFSAAFIDGCHSRHAVKMDCLEAMRLVEPGGHVILHDFNSADVQGGAADAGLEFLRSYESPHGIGIFRVPVKVRNEAAAVAVGLALLVGVMWCAVQVMGV